MKAIEETERLLAPVKKLLDEALRPGSELRRLAGAWPRLEVRFRKLSQTVHDACERAALPPFRLMSVDAWNEIERVAETEGLDAAAEVVARFAREALTHAETRAELLRDWSANPIVAKRADILEQGLRAHEHRLFAASIPIFLAQVEGIIVDSKHFPDAKRNPSFDQLKKYMSELAESDEYLGRLISEYVTDTVYQSFVRGEDTPPLSRHAILHGFDIRYANEMNSVRAILTFDCVQDLVLDHSKAPEPGE